MEVPIILFFLMLIAGGITVAYMFYTLIVEVLDDKKLKRKLDEAKTIGYRDEPTG